MDGYAMFAYLKDDIVVMCTVLKISYAPAYKNIFDAVGKIRYRMSWLLKKKKKKQIYLVKYNTLFLIFFPFSSFPFIFYQRIEFRIRPNSTLSCIISLRIVPISLRKLTR